MKPPSETATVTASATPATVRPVRTGRRRRFRHASVRYRLEIFALFICASVELHGAGVELEAVAVRDDLAFDAGHASLAHRRRHRDLLDVDAKLVLAGLEVEEAAHRFAL